MKYGSEGDKGWDASSPDAQWSGSSGTLGGGIIAARGTNDPCVLLAVDRDCQLVGADQSCRQIVEARGVELKPGLGVAAFLPIFATKASCSSAQRIYSITWHSHHRSPTTWM
jgi:hypothetical protein